MQAIPEDAVQEDSGDEEDDPDKRIPSERHLPLLCFDAPLYAVIYLMHTKC